VGAFERALGDNVLTVGDVVGVVTTGALVAMVGILVVVVGFAEVGVHVDGLLDGGREGLGVGRGATHEVGAVSHSPYSSLLKPGSVRRVRSSVDGQHLMRLS
jgi:hypothetical protein